MRKALSLVHVKNCNRLLYIRRKISSSFSLSSTCAESDLYLCGSTIGYLLAEQLSEHAQYAPIGYLLAEQLSMRSMLLLDICWLNS